MDNIEGDPQLDIVAQRWSDITLDEAGRVLAALDRPLHASRIVSHSGRPTAAGSLVLTEEGDVVFVKRYARSVRDAEGIAPYHRFVAHLIAHGVQAPPFLPFSPQTPGARGTTLSIADAVYEVSRQGRGEDRYVTALTWEPPRSVGEAEALGAFVARMSLAAEGFDEPRRAVPDPFQNRFGLFASADLDEALDAWLEERPSVAEYLAMTERDIHRDLERHRVWAERVASRYGRLDACWTHGDPHISNFLWQGDAPVSVFDFGLADRNTALFDLVQTLERHAIQFIDIANGHDDSCRPDIADAIVRGYHRVRPLDDDERALITDMLPVSQSEASLNWIAYYMKGTGRVEDAAWCYDTSLLGHTAWFHRDAGRRFLDALRGSLDALD
ncbi:phosphotransferase enzyme family protein [Bifidobacterium eulemuris]|uniref:Phosphotransferase n=1 Tax=Bifidobacterium eulemuris TaxID=1765219 RepID=A0A261G7L5_9BIFI|nr:phosphotransferase [Bifidobacterium eulemuris]OZG67421.1 aminoglycoside phosphotransferase [Bifidobacterium eulemuris]QOL32989.1 phosphotransferase [Bifidobacterium eulemuris]